MPWRMCSRLTSGATSVRFACFTELYESVNFWPNVVNRPGVSGDSRIWQSNGWLPVNEIIVAGVEGR